MVAERANHDGFNVRVRTGLFAFLADEQLEIHLIRRSQPPIKERYMRLLIGKTCRICGNVKLVPFGDRKCDGTIKLNGGVRTALQRKAHKHTAGTLLG
jgi:hypothetical protein